MTRTLLLIRHAQAAPGEGPDSQRALTPRGARDAKAVGRWLAEQGLVPDLAVVSPARRATETWAAAAAQLHRPPPVVTEARVYDNTPPALLSVLRGTADDVDALAVVGHNPSLQALAVALDDQGGDPGARRSTAVSFPTAGIAVLTVPAGWAALAPAGATVRAFTAVRA